MEREDTQGKCNETEGGNISCVHTTTKEDVLEEQMKNSKGGHHTIEQHGTEIGYNPDSNSTDRNTTKEEEDYHKYDVGYSSTNLPQVSTLTHDEYNETCSSDCSENGNVAGSVSSTGHSPSSYYDPSGILYEINHAYVVPSLEPIPENQVLSTINEETYQEPSSSYDSDTGNCFRNSQDDVFYSEVGGSSYPSPPAYSVDDETCPSSQGYQRDDVKEPRATHSTWEQDPKCEVERPNNSAQTSNSSQDLLPSPEEQSQPGKLKNRLLSEASTEEDNEVETPHAPIYTPTQEHCLTSTKTNVFPEQFDGRASKEIHGFPALDHSGHHRRPSNSDSIRDQDRKLSRNISFNVTEREVLLHQSAQDGTTKVDVSDHCNFPNPDKLSPSSTKQGHPDIDGGWAWVVVGCCFCSFVILMGLLFTCSLYYAEMLIEFGHSRSYTAWVGSLVNSFFMLGSLASSSFIHKYGCRAAMILGSLVMSTGYIMSAFATSLEMIFATYGIIVD